jgi:hypothetical protein
MLMGVLSSANVPVNMKLSSEFSGSADDGGFGLGSVLPDCEAVFAPKQRTNDYSRGVYCILECPGTGLDVFLES